MTTELICRQSIHIEASPAKVWDALTQPELIKQYFFGTECVTDWKKGSPIFFRGEWEGRPYEDKGHILEIEEGKLIRYSYWSSFSGTEDVPENYAEIRYELSSDANGTILTVEQNGFATQEAADHSAGNWAMILDGLKKLIE